MPEPKTAGPNCRLFKATSRTDGPAPRPPLQAPKREKKIPGPDPGNPGDTGPRSRPRPQTKDGRPRTPKSGARDPTRLPATPEPAPQKSTAPQSGPKPPTATALASSATQAHKHNSARFTTVSGFPALSSVFLTLTHRHRRTSAFKHGESTFSQSLQRVHPGTYSMLLLLVVDMAAARVNGIYLLLTLRG